MTIRTLSIITGSVFVAFSLQTAVCGALVADFNFDSVPLGNTPPTTAPGVDSLPEHQIYSIGGFPDAGPLTGTVTVADVGPLFHAAVMSTSQGGTGALFIDTRFSVASPFISVAFDLDIIDVPASGVPQSGLGAPNGQAFVLQAFGLDNQRFFRFAASPTSATGGNFGIRLPGPNGDLLTFGTYNEGEVHHLEFRNDMTTSITSVYLDNAFAVATPFVAPASGLFEIFIFQNGVDDVPNSVAIDNIVVASLPDTGSSAALLGTALLGLAGFNLRSQSQRKAV